MANTIITNFTGNMTKFYAAVKDGQISNETQKVTITGSSYTLDDLKAIRDEAKNATIVLQAAANPQLEGTATELIDALADIKYSGAITVSGALTTANDLANVLALTSGKVTADVTSLTAAALVEALEDEKTVNALTVTLDSVAVDASDLKILDAKTSVTVDASLVTSITGTAAELKTVLNAAGIDTPANVAVTVDGKVSAADLNTIAKATGGVVTAEVEGSAAALNAALKDVNSSDLISVTLTGATATAKDILELNAKCPDFNGDSLQTITGTFAQMKLIADGALNQALTITDTIKATDSDITALNSITSFASGAVKATVEGSAAVLAKLTASGTELLTLKVTGDTATAVDLIKVNDATSLTVNASAVKEIRGKAADLKTIYTSKTISGLGNEAVIISGTVVGADAPTAKEANVILKATTGKVTAEIGDTAANLVKGLTDAKGTDNLTLTVSAGTATAADLKALDAKTSVIVNASNVTDIKGTAADVKTVLKADEAATINLKANVAVEVTGTVSAADVNTIAKATDGIVTATVAAGTATSLLAALKDIKTETNNHLTLKVTGTANAADLNTLNDMTSSPIDAKSVTAITGTEAQVKLLADNGLNLSSTVAVTITGTIAAADVDVSNGLNDVASQTSGKVTATVSGSLSDLKNLTTAPTDAITIKVTGTTATATDLKDLDGKTSVVVDAKTITTIESLAVNAADVITVLDAKTIAKAADVAVTITDASATNTITAVQANSIAKLATGVVTATVADGSASYLNTTLKDAKGTDALTLTVNGTTASAVDLNALDGKTSEKVIVKATTTVTGSYDNLVTIYDTNSTHFTFNDSDIKISDATVKADKLNTVAGYTNGSVIATLEAATTIDDATVVTTLGAVNLSDIISLTSSVTTADATALVALAAKVNTVDGIAFASVKTITETSATDVVTALNIAGNDAAATITGGAITVANADAIADATSGTVTATVATGTAAALNAALVDSGSQVNAYTLSVSNNAGTTSATDLIGLDAKTSVAVDAGSVTDVISGSSSEVAAAYAANTAGTISGLGNETVTITGTDATVANLAAINTATSGVVTVTEVDVTAGTFSLADLFGANITNAANGITGLTTIDASTSTNASVLTLKFADLLTVDSDVSTTSGAIAVKLGAGDSLAFDTLGWSKVVDSTTQDTYTHKTGTTDDYVITVTHPVL